MYTVSTAFLVTPTLTGKTDIQAIVTRINNINHVPDDIYFHFHGCDSRHVISRLTRCQTRLQISFLTGYTALYEGLFTYTYISTASRIEI